MKRELVLLLIFLSFSLFFSANVVALNPDCGNNTILTLYSATNSHAAAYNGTAAIGTQIAICYDDFFNGNPSLQNPWQCAGNANLVLKLSSMNNAHVGNSTSGYSYDVCYDNLRCEVRTNSCVSGETAIASLSSLTNAHISSDPNSAVYNYRLCCKEVTTQSASGLWTDPITGLQIDTISQNGKVNLTVGTLNVANGATVTITVYNESNNFNLTSFSLIINDNEAEITKNISDDILMGKAGPGSKIYFNVTYSGLEVRSNTLNITTPTRGLANAKWVREGDGSYQPVQIINQTKRISLYVDTSLISNSENLTFRTYTEIGQFIEEFNVSVNYNRALSVPDYISGFVDNPDKNEEFYFNVTDSVSGIEVKSNLVKYLPNETTKVSVYDCFDRELTETQCRESVPTIRTIHNTCSNTNQLPVCSWSSGACREITQGYNEQTGEPNTICEATTDNEFTECTDGWKTLQVKVQKTDFCGGTGSCSPSNEYKVPCRAVALLPVFTLLNVIVAAGLIMIVYFVIFKTSLFNSRKK